MTELTLGLHRLHIAEPMLFAGVFISHKAVKTQKKSKKTAEKSNLPKIDCQEFSFKTLKILKNQAQLLWDNDQTP